MMFRIEIRNWEKYNPRKDLKKPSWFRLENDWEICDEFFEYSAEQKILWVHLLSSRNKRPDGSAFKLNSERAATVLKMDEQALIEMLKDFAKPGNEFISLTELRDLDPQAGSVQDPNGSVQNPNGSVQNPSMPTLPRDGRNPNGSVQNPAATRRDETLRDVTHSRACGYVDNLPPKGFGDLVTSLASTMQVGNRAKLALADMPRQTAQIAPLTRETMSGDTKPHPSNKNDERAPSDSFAAAEV